MRKGISANIRFRIIFCLCLTLVLLLGGTVAAGAEPDTEQPQAFGFWGSFVTYPDPGKVASAAVFETSSGQLIYSLDAGEIRYPASTVKIMSGALACELLEYRLEETVTVTQAMIQGVQGNSLKLKAGESLTVRDLLYGLIVGGYNDCAQALAIVSCGSLTAFIERMNEKAVSIGARDTVFTNPSGMHDPEMVTTTADVLLWARYGLSLELYRTIMNTESYMIPATDMSPSREFYNRNELVTDHRTRAYYDARCIGMNAGYTDEGGWCAVTWTHREEGSFLVAVMGGEELSSGTVSSYTTVKTLLDWAYQKFGWTTVLKPGDTVVRVPLSGYSIVSDVPATVMSEVRIFAPVSIGYRDLPGSEVRLASPSLEPPFGAGKEIGYVRLKYNGETLATEKLMTAEAAELTSLSKWLHIAKSVESHPVVLVSAVSFLVMGIALTVFLRVRFRRRMRMSRYL